MSHVEIFFDQAKQITASINQQQVERMADALGALRNSGGRLFFNWRLSISHVRAS